MTALFSSTLRHPADNLVVSTREVIKPLLDIFRKYDMDEDVLLQAILEAIAKERDAKNELALLCATPVGQWLHDPDGYLLGETQLYTNEAARLANALYKVGEHLIRQCQRHRLYNRGFLPYQYHRRWGGDLLLTKLMLPELNPPKYKTTAHYDLEDFYHRFEVR